MKHKWAQKQKQKMINNHECKWVVADYTNCKVFVCFFWLAFICVCWMYECTIHPGYYFFHQIYIGVIVQWVCSFLAIECSMNKSMAAEVGRNFRYVIDILESNKWNILNMHSFTFSLHIKCVSIHFHIIPNKSPIQFSRSLCFSFSFNSIDKMKLK